MAVVNQVKQFGSEKLMRHCLLTNESLTGSANYKFLSGEGCYPQFTVKLLQTIHI